MIWLLGLIPGAGPYVLLLKANPGLRRLLGGALMLLAVIVLVLGAYHAGRRSMRIEDAEAAENARLKAVALAQVAAVRADTQRQADNARTAALEKDLTHAYDKTPDSRPSAARMSLACARLRSQGTDVSKLPACR